MKDIYIIGETKIIEKDEREIIRNLVNFKLPEDYWDFLSNYGYGEISAELFFQKPDEKYMKNNFSDYMDLWLWEDELQRENALNGLTISTTANGDIICCVNDPDFPYLLLPRQSGDPAKFKDIYSLLLDYHQKLKWKEIYFDPYYNKEKKTISLIKDGKLDKSLIEHMSNIFSEKYTCDKVYNEETQPKYVIQEIGGWICFDLVYRNTIAIKYQSMFVSKANEIITFVEKQLRTARA
jgi:hypothetical protein